LQLAGSATGSGMGAAMMDTMRPAASTKRSDLKFILMVMASRQRSQYGARYGEEEYSQRASLQRDPEPSGTPSFASLILVLSMYHAEEQLYFQEQQLQRINLRCHL